MKLSRTSITKVWKHQSQFYGKCSLVVQFERTISAPTTMYLSSTLFSRLFKLKKVKKQPKNIYRCACVRMFLVLQFIFVVLLLFLFCFFVLFLCFYIDKACAFSSKSETFVNEILASINGKLYAILY